MARMALSMKCALGLLLLAAAPSWKPALERQRIDDARVLAAFERVRRADFLPDEQKPHEMEDRPLSIGFDQTTSQPSLIALMIQAMGLKPGCRVLEVGTGSGFQTALLAELCAEVESVE